MHPNCLLLFEKYARVYFKDNMRILEIGPSIYPLSPFQKIVNNNSIDWQALDICNTLNVTYVADNEYKFPIPDNTFDIVISANVIEHVKKVWVWIKEVYRVCKVGGHVITIVPVSWPFHGTPVDCWRIYPDGMRALYEEAGLAVDLCKCETLEKHGRRRVVAGETNCFGDWRVGAQLKDSVIKSIIKDVVRWPTTYAFDTVAVGTKEKK